MEIRIKICKEKILMREKEDMQKLEKRLNALGFLCDSRTEKVGDYDVYSYTVNLTSQDYNKDLQPYVVKMSEYFKDAFVLAEAMYPNQIDLGSDTVLDFECYKGGKPTDDYQMELLNADMNPKLIRCKKENDELKINEKGDLFASFYEFDFNVKAKIGDTFYPIKPMKFIHIYHSHNLEKQHYNMFMDKLVPKALYGEDYEPEIVKDWKDKYYNHSDSFKELEEVERE